MPKIDKIALLFERPGVNFINVLQATFTCADPEIAKKTVKSSSCFALLGSSSVKAAHRTLMKLTPGWHGMSQVIKLRFWVEHKGWIKYDPISFPYRTAPKNYLKKGQKGQIYKENLPK